MREDYGIKRLLLFVGGEADGMWIEVPDVLDIFEVAIPDIQPALVSHSPDPPTNIADFTMSVHLYERMPWSTSNQKFFIMVPTNTSPEDSIRRLINGYKK